MNTLLCDKNTTQTHQVESDYVHLKTNYFQHTKLNKTENQSPLEQIKTPTMLEFKHVNTK